MKKCLLALALLFAVLLSGCAIVQTTDLADYGNTGGETWHGSAVFDLLSNLTSTGDADGTQSAAPPRMQELFPIFPPDALLQRAQDRDYHHLYRYTLLQDELFTRLSCRYSAADYQAEVDASRRSAQPMTRRSSACPPISGCSTTRTTPNMSCWRNPRARSTTLPARRTIWLPLPCPRAGIPASRSGPSASRRPRERRMHHDLPAVRHRECR